MVYFKRLWNRSSKETWDLVIESPARVVGIGFYIVLFSAVYTCVGMGRVEATSFLTAFGVVSLATITVFSLVFVAHFLIITPKHLWIESQKEISKNKKLLAEWEELYKPKLALQCGADILGSMAPCAGGYDFDSTFRVVIRSLGLNPLPNCQGRIIEILRDGQHLWGGEEMPLTFVLSGDQYSTHKQIDPNLPSYLEVIGVKDGKLKVATNKHGRTLGQKTDDAIQQRGSYSIAIAVATFNSVSIQAMLTLIWTGTFETSSLTLIEQHSLSPATHS